MVCPPATLPTPFINNDTTVIQPIVSVQERGGEVKICFHEDLGISLEK